MKQFEFNVFVTVNAEDYDSAIDIFDMHLKFGKLRRDHVYVAEIEEK
jgi:hypothetical protein